jgi:cytochrome P450
MQIIENASPADHLESAAARCPVDHSAWPQQKTIRAADPTSAPIERDAQGRWHVRGFEEARAVLRSGDTKQAGFNAEFLDRMPGMNQPILYLEGKAHQQQRKQTARFFTPKTVSTSYRQLMERLADQMVTELQRRKLADLSQLSLKLAVRVAAEVVGVTNSLLPGMDKRLDVFFQSRVANDGWRQRMVRRLFGKRWEIVKFFFLDVKPAIRARKRQPKEDVISHLLSLNYSDTEILTECVTYAAAGMVTTREFISVAAWHFLEHPALRERYLVAPEAERHAMLEETLRLEPVVGNLSRRATADLKIESNGEQVIIPKGAFIDIQISQANLDETITGEHPELLCPGRKLRHDNIPAALMGFGDGHHRCPGAYIAIQETDIFLQRLLALEGLRIERLPIITWNDLTTGYELRKFIIAVD